MSDHLTAYARSLGVIAADSVSGDAPVLSLPFTHDLEGRPGLIIEVSDTGVGMTSETMQKIFDPFFTTKRQQGTGLGLSISQTLVTRQGGKIFAESEPGRGTTFTIWLPEAA